MLTLENVSLDGAHGRRLDALSLTLPEPQLVGVIGANGAGKSSLLSILAGIEDDYRGQVTIAGGALSGFSAEQRVKRLAYLPQSEQVQWDVSVQQLLAIGLLRQPLTSSQRQQRIAHWLQECQLVGLADRTLSTLSGGERQRVLLARALVAEAPLLLCDEPTSALDIGHQLELMTMLKRQASQGQMVLCSLHDLSLAARYCDRLVLLHEGRLLAAGEPAEVLTDQNLAAAFSISAEWVCKKSGVAWIPQPL